jgi:hypothetical protein
MDMFTTEASLQLLIRRQMIAIPVTAMPTPRERVLWRAANNNSGADYQTNKDRLHA